MKVSIVIPVYNTEKYVEECVESALSQTYGSCEVVVIDDGSTDGSKKILEEFSDRITLISKKNGGTASALNEGIRHMSGDWFKWLSADDRLYPNGVEDLMNAVSTTECARDCIFYGEYDLIDVDGKVLGRHLEPDFGKLGSFQQNVALLTSFYGNGTTALIHKSAFDRHGYFDEGLGINEDYEMWLRLCVLHGFRLHLVPENIAQYRIHGGQLTATQNRKGHLVDAKTIQGLFEKMDPATANRYKTAMEEYGTIPVTVRALGSPWRMVKRILPKGISRWVKKTYVQRKQSRI